MGRRASHPMEQHVLERLVAQHTIHPSRCVVVNERPGAIVAIVRESSEARRLRDCVPTFLPVGVSLRVYTALDLLRDLERVRADAAHSGLLVRELRADVLFWRSLWLTSLAVTIVAAAARVAGWL